MYFIGGVIFLVFGFIDMWVFQFNPLQVNIFLDQYSDLRASDMSLIKESHEKKSQCGEHSFSRTDTNSISTSPLKSQQTIDKEVFEALKETSKQTQ